MKPLEIALVKPHPPSAVLADDCPVHEDQRYNWTPTALQFLAAKLLAQYQDEIKVKIWHLMNLQDDAAFEEYLNDRNPDIVAFSEIDLLVNEVNKLASIVRNTSPNTTTIVGGKQSSLLRAGDKMPFSDVDYTFRGGGVKPLKGIIDAQLRHKIAFNLEGLVCVDQDKKVISPSTFSPREEIKGLTGRALYGTQIEGHPYPDYFEEHQKFPSNVEGEVVTAALYIGSGCQYNCDICQSPVEFGQSGKKLFLREPTDIADEIYYLNSEQGVNNFFSVEPNMSLKNLLEIYEELERQYEIKYMSIAGFVRVGDVIKAEESGLLAKLVERGMKVLSIGLDIPLDTKEDIYRKSYTFEDMVSCLEICKKHGIVVAATAVADPQHTKQSFAEYLEFLKSLPVAKFDLRCAIALRNTTYYQTNQEHLIAHPDQNRAYFDWQNYRYQTIQIPGAINPDETYALIEQFYRDYPVSDEHIAFVLQQMHEFPETKHLYRREYMAYLEREGRSRFPVELNSLTL